MEVKCILKINFKLTGQKGKGKLLWFGNVNANYFRRTGFNRPQNIILHFKSFAKYARHSKTKQEPIWNFKKKTMQIYRYLKRRRPSIGDVNYAKEIPMTSWKGSSVYAEWPQSVAKFFLWQKKKQLLGKMRNFIDQTSMHKKTSRRWIEALVFGIFEAILRFSFQKKVTLFTDLR